MEKRIIIFLFAMALFWAWIGINSQFWPMRTIGASLSVIFAIGGVGYVAAELPWRRIIAKFWR